MKLLKNLFLLLIIIASFSSCTKFDSDEDLNQIENIQSDGGEDDDVLADDDDFYMSSDNVSPDDDSIQPGD